VGGLGGVLSRFRQLRFLGLLGEFGLELREIVLLLGVRIGFGEGLLRLLGFGGGFLGFLPPLGHFLRRGFSIVLRVHRRLIGQLLAFQIIERLGENVLSFL